MSAVTITEGWRGRPRHVGKTARRCMKTFQVEVSSAADDPLVAERAVLPGIRIPRRGETHPADSTMVVEDLDTRAIGPTVYEVAVHYRNMDLGEGGGDEDDPLQQPPGVHWTSATSEEATDTDIHGDPIINSSGESWDPPVTKTYHDPVLVLTRNELDFNPLTPKKYRDTVAAAGLFGWPKETPRMMDIDAENFYHGEKEIFRVAYTIQFRDDVVGETVINWKTRRLDQGYRYWDGERNVYRTIRDGESGQPLTRPSLLDGQANVLAKGGEAVYILFDLYPPADWGELNLALR